MSRRGDQEHGPSRDQRVGLLQGELTPTPDPPAGAAGGRLHRLRPSAEPFPVASGEIYLIRSGGDDLVVPDPDPVDRALLDLLARGEHAEARLRQALGVDAATLAGKLAALEAAGVLLSRTPQASLDPADAARFDRQLPYLAERGDPELLQLRLRAAHVVVLGCGGLGTWGIAALAAAGVGRFTVVDDDVVDPSNLNRQILYGTADVGRPKVDAVAHWLAAFDPRIAVAPHRVRVDAPDVLPALLAGADAALLLADAPPYRLARWVNAACLERGVPFITAGQVPPLLRVGPLYVPGATACFACHERALRRANPRYDEYVEHAQSTPYRGATLGTASGIAGTLLASEVAELLVGAHPASAGAALIVDLRTLELRREAIARDPRCPACEHLGRGR